MNGYPELPEGFEWETEPAANPTMGAADYTEGLASTWGYNDPMDDGTTAWGGNVNSPNAFGVSLPIQTLRDHFGDEDEAEGAMVEVTNPATGRTIIAPIVDKGPADWVVARQGPTIDLTEGARRDLGSGGLDPAQWRILGKPPKDWELETPGAPSQPTTAGLPEGREIEPPATGGGALLKPPGGWEWEVPENKYGENLNPTLTQSLYTLEQAAGVPLKINSGYRDPDYNRKVGGASGSQHIHGNAVDIDVSDMSTEERLKLIETASASGIQGVGVYENSLHFDVGERRSWGPNYHSDSVPEWAQPTVLSHLRGEYKMPDAPTPPPRLPEGWELETPQTRQQTAAQNRDRLSQDIAQTEKAGYAVPHFIGTPDEPEGDRGPTMDMENLVVALKKQEAATTDSAQAAQIAEKRAYWENAIKTQGMSAEQWKRQTGENDPSLITPTTPAGPQPIGPVDTFYKWGQDFSVAKEKYAQTQQAQGKSVDPQKAVSHAFQQATTNLSDESAQSIGFKNAKELKGVFKMLPSNIMEVDPATANEWFSEALRNANPELAKSGQSMLPAGEKKPLTRQPFEYTDRAGAVLPKMSTLVADKLGLDRWIDVSGNEVRKAYTPEEAEITDLAVKESMSKDFSRLPEELINSVDTAAPFPGKTQAENLPRMSALEADRLGLQRWRDAQSGMEVRRATPVHGGTPSPTPLVPKKYEGMSQTELQAKLEAAKPDYRPEWAPPAPAKAVEDYRPEWAPPPVEPGEGLAGADLVKLGLQGATDQSLLSILEGGYAAVAGVLPEGKIRDNAIHNRDEISKMRTNIREKHLPVDPKAAQSFLGGLANTVGQMPVNLLSYAIPGLGPLTSVLTLYDEGRQDYRDTMKEQGKPVDEAKANEAGWKYAMAAGPIDIAMDKLQISKFFKASQAKGWDTGKILKEGAQLYTGGAAGEGLQQLWLNTVAKLQGDTGTVGYDPNRPTFQDVPESAAVGGGASLLVGGAGAARKAPSVETALNMAAEQTKTQRATGPEAPPAALAVQKPRPPAVAPAALAAEKVAPTTEPAAAQPESIVGKTLQDIAPQDITKDRKGYMQKRRAEGATIEEAAAELSAETDRVKAQMDTALPEGSQIKDPGTGRIYEKQSGDWVGVEKGDIKGLTLEPDSTIVRVGYAPKPTAAPGTPADLAAQKQRPPDLKDLSQLPQGLGTQPETRTPAAPTTPAAALAAEKIPAPVAATTPAGAAPTTPAATAPESVATPEQEAEVQELMAQYTARGGAFGGGAPVTEPTTPTGAAPKPQGIIGQFLGGVRKAVLGKSQYEVSQEAAKRHYKERQILSDQRHRDPALWQAEIEEPMRQQAMESPVVKALGADIEFNPGMDAPMAAAYSPSGKLTLVINPVEMQALENTSGNTGQAFSFYLGEELDHFGEIATVKDTIYDPAVKAHNEAMAQWQAGGRQGPAPQPKYAELHDAIKENRARLFVDMRSSLKNAPPSEQQALYQAAVDAYNVYFAQAANQPSPGSKGLKATASQADKIFAEIASRPGSFSSFIAEFTRQARQQRNQGNITESVWRKVLELIKGWYRQSLDRLQQSLPGVQEGKFGPAMQQHVQNIEDFLSGKGVEIAPPGAPTTWQKGGAKGLPAPAKNIVNIHNAHGGSTINAVHGDLTYTNAYSVAIFNELTTSVPGKRITEQHIRDFEAKMTAAGLDPGSPNLSIGTWYDAKNDVTDIDVVFTTTDLKRATSFGQQFNQKAIYDLGSLKEIPLGGTRAPLASMPSAQERLAILFPIEYTTPYATTATEEAAGSEAAKRAAAQAAQIPKPGGPEAARQELRGLHEEGEGLAGPRGLPKEPKAPKLEPTDQAYMDAVKRGDMETAQHMVDEAANRAGFTIEAWKGYNPKKETGETITVIERPGEFPAFNRGEPNVAGIQGFFSSDKTVAEHFTKGIGAGAITSKFRLAFKNPFEIDAKGKHAGVIQFGATGKAFRDAVRTGKYDGIIIRNTKDEGTVYVALDSKGIKSAAPVTYDVNGNVIALSERFNREKKYFAYGKAAPKPKPESAEAEARRYEAGPAGIPAAGTAPAGRPVPPDARITRHIARLFSGAREVFWRTEGLEFAGDAITRQVDIEQAMKGDLGTPLVARGILGGTRRSTAYREFKQYVDTWLDPKKGRAAADALGIGNEAQRLVDNARESIRKMKDHAARLGMTDGPQGEFPTILSNQTMNAIENPAEHRAHWDRLKDDMVRDGLVPKGTPDQIQTDARILAAKIRDDYLSGKDVTGKLPTSAYDHGLLMLTRYVNDFSKRASLKEAFGSRAFFAHARKLTTDDTARNYLTIIENHAFGNMSAKGIAGKITDVASTLASGSQLGNPESTSRNLLGGIAGNVTRFGIGSNINPINVIKAFAAIKDGKEKGLLLNDFQDAVNQANKLGMTWKQKAHPAALAKWFTSTMLKAGGYNAAETFVRAHGIVQAKALERWSRNQYNKNPKSRGALQFLGLAKRLGFGDPEALIKADGKGPLYDTYLRRLINRVQGGYTYADVTAFLASDEGGFIQKYGKWGSEHINMVVRDVIAPFIRGPMAGVHAIVPERLSRTLGTMPETVTVTNPATGKKETMRVPGEYMPLLRYALVMAAVGQGWEWIAENLFGTKSRYASWAEIGNKLSRGDRQAIGDAMAKTFLPMLGIGFLGALGDRIRSGVEFWSGKRTLDELIVDTPIVGMLKDISNEAQDFFDREDYQTREGWMSFADKLATKTWSYYRSAKKIAGVVKEATGFERDANDAIGFVAREAEKSVRLQDKAFVRSVGRRIDAEMGMVKPRMGEGSGPTAATAIKERLSDHIELGEVEEAQALIDSEMEKLEGDKKAQDKFMKGLEASVRNKQPINALGGGEAGRVIALRWMEENLPPDQLAHVERSDQNYRETATQLGLMKGNKHVPESEVRELEESLLRARERNQADSPWGWTRPVTNPAGEVTMEAMRQIMEGKQRLGEFTGAF